MGFLDVIRARIAAAIHPALDSKSYSSIGSFSLLTSAPATWTRYQIEKAIAEGYYQDVWVNRCVGLKATALASVPWVLEERKGSMWERSEGHDLEMLAEFPNKHMPRQNFVELLFIFLFLSGEANSQKIIVNGKPTELWPLDTRFITPKPGEKPKIGGKEGETEEDQFIAWYEREFKDTPRKQRLETEQVMRFLLPDPGNFRRGQGQLRSVSRQVDIYLEALEYGKKSMENRGALDSMLTPKESGLRADQRKELRDLVTAQQRDRERILTLGIPVNHQRISMTPAEMQVGDAVDRIAKETCIGFGVDPSLFMPTTFRNKEHARRALWEDTLMPEVERAQAAYNLSLVPHFGNRETMRLRMDISNVPALAEDLEGKVQAYVQLVNAGVPPNMAAERVELGLPDIPNGDEPRSTDSGVTIDDDEEAKRGTRKRKVSEVSATVRRQEEINREILKLADDVAETMEDDLLLVWGEIRASVSSDEILTAFAAGNLDRVVALFPWVRTASETAEVLAKRLVELWEKVAKLAAEMLTEATGVEVEPQRVSPALVVEPAKRSAQLMTDSSRNAIRETAEALDESPLFSNREKATIILAIFGGNLTNALQLLKFLRGAEESGVEGLLERVVERAAALVTERAANVAEGESLAVAAASRSAMFRLSKVQGAEKTFITNEDERVCKICDSMHLQIVPIDKPYYSSVTDQFYDRPGPGPDGVHPKCRCGEIVSIVS